MTRIKYQTSEWGGPDGTDYLECEIQGHRVMIEITDTGIEIMSESGGLQVIQVAVNSVKLAVGDVSQVKAPVNRAGLD
jgi:hypothetical protein